MVYGQLARARSLRYVWHSLRRPSKLEAYSAARRVAWSSVAERLRHSYAGHRLGARKPGDRERTVADARDTYRRLPQRRNHGSRRRRNHHKHGAAASFDARCAAREAEARRREGGGLRVHHRLPAPWGRENRRAPHLPAVCPLRGPHGLRRRGEQRPGLLRGGREIDERRGAAARPRHPHYPHRAAANREPPALARHARAGYWRTDAAVLLFPGARRNSEDF